MEPFPLRFSALFVQCVGMNCKQSMFYGTTVRGVKFWDPYYFFATYAVAFLDRLPEEMTCRAGGKASTKVANYVQKALGFGWTSLKRKDKYMLLGGNEGKVESMYNSTTTT